MKTKIGMTFGLALMLAVGVLGTMLALGMFDAGSVKAAHGTKVAAADAGSTLGENVSSASWTATPNDPGAESKVELSFVTYTQLDALTDSIIIEFEDDYDVPSVIDPNTVTIKASRITNPGTDVTGNMVAYPLDVTVELVGTPADESLVTLSVPDMDPGTGSVGAGLQSIDAGATVTVTFKQTAGIKNPTEAKDKASAGYIFYVSTSDKTDQVTSGNYSIPRQVKVSATTGERGKTITVTGKGFENSTSATVWLDYNRDGTLDAGETTLATATVASDNTFEATFQMAKPPFVRSASSDTTDGTNYNAINAIDGEGNTICAWNGTACTTYKDSAVHAQTDIPLIGYEGKLSIPQQLRLSATRSPLLLKSSTQTPPSQLGPQLP